MISILSRQGLLSTTNGFLSAIRNASKKTGGSTKNPKDPHGIPKHRGWKRQDGSWVTAKTILALQTKPNWLPGLHVGWGVNGTLYALRPGKVYVTCEKSNLNFNKNWVQRFFAGRENQTIYKKYFNVVPIEQHQRFRLIDEI